MEIFDCIKARRSIRSYLDQSIDKSDIEKIIEAAIWAPSGKNGQPWKFRAITDKGLIVQISDMSVHGKWMKSAPCFICVFLDKEKSYNYLRDVQSCGAAIQNLLLCAQSMGISSCWTGEILGKSDRMAELLKYKESRYELMAIVTLGYTADRAFNPGRRDVESFLFESGDGTE